MATSQEITAVESCDLVGIVAGLYSDGYRLVQIGCSTLPLAYELTYSFDKDYRLINYRITIAPEEEVPSISVIYPNAFLYENEIHDLFGVPIRHISVDYRGTLYRTTVSTPFSVDNVKLPEPPKKKAPAAEKKAASEAAKGAEPEAAKGAGTEGKTPEPVAAKGAGTEAKAPEPEAAKGGESEVKTPGPEAVKAAGSEGTAPGPEAAKGAEAGPADEKTP